MLFSIQIKFHIQETHLVKGYANRSFACLQKIIVVTSVHHSIGSSFFCGRSCVGKVIYNSLHLPIHHSSKTDIVQHGSIFQLYFSEFLEVIIALVF